MSSVITLLFFFLISVSAYGKAAKSTVILLSIDGFSYDYLARYQPKNILEFGKIGASGKLLPVYPSKTFPNHLSIITGNYPENHGIIHNKFYHPDLKKKYHSTVIFVTSSMEVAYKIADRIFMVVSSDVLDIGSPEETKQHPDPRVQQFIQGKLTGPIDLKSL